MLNPYNSSRTLALLFLTQTRVGRQHLEQISVSTASTGMCGVPELDHESIESNTGSFPWVLLPAHNPVKGNPETAERIKRYLEITDGSPGGF